MASTESGDRRPIVKVTAVIATGLASAGAAFLTSRFGIAGTVIGTALTVMLITAGSSILETYLETAKERVRALLEGLPARRAGATVDPLADTAAHGPRSLFAGFSSPVARRRVRAGGLVAAFAIGMGAVTGIEIGVGKSLSCWLWEGCPAEVAYERSYSDAGTRPSILGGGWAEGGSAGDRPAEPGRAMEASPPESSPGSQDGSAVRLDPGELRRPYDPSVLPSAPGEVTAPASTFPEGSPPRDTTVPAVPSPPSEDGTGTPPPGTAPSPHASTDERPHQGS